MELLPENVASNIGASLAFLTVFLAYIYFLYGNKKRSKLPPGPRPLPVIGNLLQLRHGGPREPLRRLAEQYGDVLLLYLGHKPTVFLCSYDAIKEAFVKRADVFSGRPKDDIFLSINPGLGIVGTDGPMWREQRSFTHRTLRDFGMGKSLIESQIQEEVPFLVTELTRHQGEPFNFREAVHKAVSNIIQRVVIGNRCDYDDVDNDKRVAILHDNGRLIGSSGIRNVLPFLEYLPGDFFEFKRLRTNFEALLIYNQQMIDEHKLSHEAGDVRDFIDAYLQEIQKTNDDPDSPYTELQLRKIITELFGAGTETTSTTLRWAIVFMLRHPEFMQKVKAEIDDVIGSSRMPSVTDRSSMPFTDATLLEIQRCGDIAFLGIPHATTADVEFRGYHLPRGTTVISSLYCVHRDPSVWKQPDQFNPYRFIGADGKVDKQHAILPFSAGKRVCVGESLARAELFIFFVSLMQQLEISLPVGRPLPELEGNMGITYGPKDFDICVTLRQ